MQRQIYLFSPIDDYTAQYVVGQLLEYDRQSSEEITMFINSPGGSVNAMFAIIDMMSIVSSPIRVVVTGTGASCAAVIASCGKKRLITENSRMMIHEVWTIIGGTMSQLDETVAQVTKEQEKLLSILAKNCGKSKDDIRRVMLKTDKYFDAKESVEFGLCDEVITEKSAQVLKLSESIRGESFEIESTESEKKDVQLLRTGRFNHPEYGLIIITDEMMNQFIENFENKVRGIDISIDCTHENETGEHPAAAWMKSLEIRDKDNGKALFARCEFTPLGLKKVKQKEYKYASADFVMDYVTESGNHVPYVLRGGTLTNRPFIKGMESIKLSETNNKSTEVRSMDKTAMLNLLKEQHQVDVVSMEASITGLKSQIETLQNQIKDLNKLPLEKDAEIKTLKSTLVDLTNKMNQEEKLRVFNALVESGKVLPAQKDTILATFGTSDKILDFYKDAPAVVKMSAEGHNGGGDASLTADEQILVSNGVLTKEDIIKHRTIEKKV